MSDTKPHVQPPVIDRELYAVTGKQYPHWVGHLCYAIMRSAETTRPTWRIFYRDEHGRTAFLPGYDYTLKQARDRASSVGDLTEDR